MTDLCPQCGNEYQRVATHWSTSSSCHAPELPSGVKDILRGLALTGGRFYKPATAANPRIEIVASDKSKIETFQSVLGVFGGDSITTSDGNSPHHEEATTCHEWGTIRHPYICKEVLWPRPGAATPLAAKTILTMGGSFAEEYTYLFPLPEDRVEIATEHLSQFDFQPRQHSTGSKPRLRTTNPDEFAEFADVEWPRGWWNEHYL